jgi:hypothetical protein
MRPYFVHIRPKTQNTFSIKGGITVAIVGDPDNGYKAGVAHCSKKDNYCKRAGRILAGGRAFENSTRINLPDDISNLKNAEQHVRALFLFN